MAADSVPRAAPRSPARDLPPRALPISGQIIPSFPLVASHFALAFLWAAIGAAGLLAIAPLLAHGSFLDPRMLAVTHLFTLGFLTTAITGVLYQIFPAMLGIGERSRRVAWASLGLLAGGTALLVCGLLLGQRTLQALGWVVLFAAVFGTAWNLLPQRRRAPRNRQLGIYISYAHMGFGFAMLIAGVRIGDAYGWWTTPRLGLISAHLHLGLLGFVTMTAVGVGSRMIPMFFGSAVPIPDWCDRAMPRLLATGVVGYAAGAVTGSAALAWGGIVLMAGAGLLFARLGLGWFRSRARPGLDPATAFLTIALSALAAAIPLGLTSALTGPGRPGTLLAYIVALLLGWAGFLVVGVSYRVLPTLTWHYRFAARIGRPGVPTLPMMLHPALGWAAVFAGGTGLLLLLGALLGGSTAAARAGTALYAVALITTVFHHSRMLLIGRHQPASAGAPR